MSNLAGSETLNALDYVFFGLDGSFHCIKKRMPPEKCSNSVTAQQEAEGANASRGLYSPGTYMSSLTYAET
jgi:hypothetical protein